MSDVEGVDSGRAAGEAPSTPVVPAVAAAPPNLTPTKGRPRGRPSKKPKIDIDSEIQEATKLAEVLRKMQQASKAAARNGTRAKQRLVRKAGKLSSDDLMRLAVLKRCGLVPAEKEGGDTMDMDDDKDSCKASPFSMAGSAAAAGPGMNKLTKKLTSHLAGVAGAAELFTSIDNETLTTEAAKKKAIAEQKRAARASARGSSSAARPGVPVASPLP